MQNKRAEEVLSRSKGSGEVRGKGGARGRGRGGPNNVYTYEQM
jgi:hypothetical protein